MLFRFERLKNEKLKGEALLLRPSDVEQRASAAARTVGLSELRNVATEHDE